jgi:hypothetical protein
LRAREKWKFARECPCVKGKIGQSKETWRPQFKSDRVEIGFAREGQKVKARMGQSRAKWWLLHY